MPRMAVWLVLMMVACRARAQTPVPEAGAVFEPITYKSDGLQIRGFVARPAGKGPFPCVIVNRGGNSKLGVWTEASARASLGRFARWGYVAIASQYRGAGGSEGKDEFGGADVDDVMNLFPVLESIPSADLKRVGMFGASRGGMMTFLALQRTNRIRAAVVLSGVSDLEQSARERPEFDRIWRGMMPGYDEHRDDLLRARSAIRFIDRLPRDVPLLVIHGSADWRVQPLQTFELVKALTAAKHPVRFVLYEGGSHGVVEFADQRNAEMRSFLDDYVRDGKKWPDLNPHGE